MTLSEGLRFIGYLINLGVGKETGGLAAVDQFKATHLPAHFPTHIAQVDVAVYRPGRNNYNQLGSSTIRGFSAKKRPYQG